mgnify:CR=1 FL=1
MASKAKVAELFELPYFKQMIPQYVQPMMAAYAEIATDSAEEAAEYLAATEAVSEKVFTGMLAMVRGFYEEVMTDEEVAVMIDIYQNPAFMKLMEMMPKMMPRMVDWFEENEEMLMQTVADAMGDEAA